MRRPITCGQMKAACFLLPVLFIVFKSQGDTKIREEDFAWGKQRKGIKIGIRIDKINGAQPDLFSFSVAVKNLGDQPVVIANGDSWLGSNRPEFVIRDKDFGLMRKALKTKMDRMLSPAKQGEKQVQKALPVKSPSSLEISNALERCWTVTPPHIIKTGALSTIVPIGLL